MAVGLQPTQAEINKEAGEISREVFNLLRRANDFKDWLDSRTDADLAAPSFGYSLAEIATLRAAFDDIGVLLAAFTGQAPLPQQRDYRTELRRLFGF